jgi:multidrug efflux pump subunit AcrA (membrane-fusion protein)
MERALIALAVVATAATAGYSLWRAAGAAASTGSILALPTTAVRRGDVVFTVAAKGELQGGNSEMITAPTIGGGMLAITELRETGDLVKAGEVIVRFSTLEQEFKLREAEADLAEAEQQVIQATAESEAKQEEARYALLQARSELKLAELEARKNELLPAMVAKQNELAIAAARDKVQQLEKDLGDRIATAKAGIAIQQAARAKAQVAAETARKNIESMTIKAKSSGYFARMPNQEGNFQWGTYQPPVQVGDTVEAGVGVAQIPDMAKWEVTAQIGELDRGHLALGQEAEIEVVALPRRKFNAKIVNIGGTSGPPWNRRFECRLAIQEAAPELRAGMSARIVITTGKSQNSLWLPSQALFESDGRKFVYLKTGDSFAPHDVKMLRRSESQVVVEGVSEGQVVALASPDQMKQNPADGKGSGALKAIAK